MSTIVPSPGDRVRMTGVMPNDPAPLPVGAIGTVREANAATRQIFVDWDSGPGLILLTTDPFEIISS